MKIAVSYISSLYDKVKTIELINETNASSLHADLMDGCYVENKNFDINELDGIYENNRLPIEFHLMVSNPEELVNSLYKYNPSCIYIHPSTCKNIEDLINVLKSKNIEIGIAINPDERVRDFEYLFKKIDRVLLMTVKPGLGGQEFIMDTIVSLNELKIYKDVYDFKIYVDGGINDETIKLLGDIDGVVVGSFICKSENYQNQINKLIVKNN